MKLEQKSMLIRQDMFFLLVPIMSLHQAARSKTLSYIKEVKKWEAEEESHSGADIQQLMRGDGVWAPSEAKVKENLQDKIWHIAKFLYL